MNQVPGVVRVVMGLLVLLLVGGFAQADPGGKINQMTGRLKKIDKPKKFVLLTVPLGDGIEQDAAFDIAKKTEVVIDGKKARLDDLKPGDQVRIYFHRIITTEEYEDGSIRGRVIDRVLKLSKANAPD